MYKNISSVIGLVYWQLKAEVETFWESYTLEAEYIFALSDTICLYYQTAFAFFTILLEDLRLIFAGWSQVIGKQGSKKGSFVG